MEASFFFGGQSSFLLVAFFLGLVDLCKTPRAKNRIRNCAQIAKTKKIPAKKVMADFAAILKARYGSSSPMT
jgi:hypothetical protein